MVLPLRFLGTSATKNFFIYPLSPTRVYGIIRNVKRGGDSLATRFHTSKQGNNNMKKLIPMIAGVACAITAFAAQKTPLTVSDFEALTPGNPLSMEGTMWTKAETDEAPVIATYEGSGTTAYTYDGQDTLTENAVGNKYLAIETSAGPLFRNNDSDKQSIATEDLYIDTLVKFTVTDAETTPEADADAKLALWLQDAGTTTNLMLRCGDHNADTRVLGKKTVTLNAGTIELNDTIWYRLTVRALKSAEIDDMGVAIAAFKIFLNGNELADTDGATEFLACVAGTSLTAVGFKGNGGVDDVAFADELGAPSFAIPPVTKLTITWDTAKVTSLKINGTAVENTGSAEVEPVEGTVSVTEIVCPDNWFAADQDFTAESKSFEVVVTTAGAVAGGKKYASLEAALAAGEGSIMLKSANVLTAEVVLTDTVEIDLAGQTITTNFQETDMFYVRNGSLTIVDSVGNGKIVATAGDIGTIFYNSGTLVIGSADGFAPTFEGAKLNDAEGNPASIVKGAFDATKNTQDEIQGMVANKETDEAVVEGNYIVVKAKSASEPVALTSVVLSTTTVEYGTTTAPTATVKAGETTVDAANYDISYSAVLTATTAVGTEITVTATAKGTDYKGTASATFTVVAKAVTPAITLSATTAEFSDTLALPTVTVDGYTLDTDYDVAWDKSLPTENPAEAVELTVTVTMKGNYTGSNTATFTVTPKAASELPGEGFVENKTAYQAWAAANGITTETEATPDMAADLAVAFLLGANKTETVTLAEAAQAKVDELITAANIDVSKLATGDALTKEFQAALAANGLQAQLLPTTAADGLVSTATAKFFKLVIKLAVQNAE